MNINSMEYLIAAIEAGSISAAAKELYITPQGLSQALQQIEREIGEKLYYRQGNRLQLTAIGEVIYNFFKRMAAENAEMRKQVSELKGRNARQETILIVATPVIVCSVLPPVVSTFQRRNPAVFLKIIERQPEEYFCDVDFDQHSIGFAAIPKYIEQQFLLSIPENTKFVTAKVCPMLACIPVKSSLARRESVTIRELEKGRLALFGGDVRYMRDQPGGFDRSAVAIESRSIELCRSVMADSENVYGITNVVTEKYLHNPKLTNVPFRDPTDISYGYVIDAEDPSPAIKELAELFEKEFTDV